MTDMKVTIVLDEQELPNEMSDLLEKVWKRKILSIDLNFKSFLRSARLYPASNKTFDQDLKCLDFIMEDLSKMFLKVENIRNIFQEFVDFQKTKESKESLTSDKSDSSPKLDFSDS